MMLSLYVFAMVLQRLRITILHFASKHLFSWSQKRSCVSGSAVSMFCNIEVRVHTRCDCFDRVHNAGEFNVDLLKNGLSPMKMHSCRVVVKMHAYKVFFRATWAIRLRDFRRWNRSTSLSIGSSFSLLESAGRRFRGRFSEACPEAAFCWSFWRKRLLSRLGHD